MKKETRRKWTTVVLLLAAVIAIVEFQNYMKRNATACADGSCAVPEEYAAAKVTGPQNVPIPSSVQTKTDLPLPTLIDFGAGQCATCKMMDIVLNELAQDFREKLTIRSIDVHEQKELTQQYAIRMIPTQIFLDAQGHELFRHEGFISKEDILKKWAKLGVSL